MKTLIRFSVYRYCAKLAHAAIVAATALTAPAAFASYPEKPIRLVVPLAPGGGTDQVAKSPPDGYAIVIATFAHAVNPSLVPRLPYNADKAFAPITLIGKGPNVLVVRADSPFKSITDLLGGQVDMIFGTAAAVSSFVDSGKLRALGVTSASASEAFTGVPPIAQDLPGYQVESWYGLYAPAGTPADIILKLNAAAKKAALSPEFSQKIEQEGLTVVASDPAELERYVKAEEARSRKIIKEKNIKAN